MALPLMCWIEVKNKKVRAHSSIDRLILSADKILRATAGSIGTTPRPSPAQSLDETGLSAEEKLRSSRLMRVNHCGEVCAQALYQGQALTTGNQKITLSMQQAALEETDHLAWCEQRLRELDARVSVLNPLWYASSFTMGAITGLLGDRINLGFVAATEAQVCKHLDNHLEKLPSSDRKSRAILTQMRVDEKEHENNAISHGGARFPSVITSLMAGVSKLMTRTTYWV